MHADILLWLLLRGLRLLLAGRLGALGLPSCLACQPDGLANVVIGELVVDAIGGEGNEIMLLCDLERSDVRNCLDNVWIAAAVLKLGLRVAKSPANRQTAWKDADWPHDKLWVSSLLRRLDLLLVEHLGSRRLVNLPASLNDSFVFFDVRGLVIPTQRGHLLARVGGENSATVAHVGDVADLTDYQHDYGTRARSLNHCHLPSSLILGLAHFQKSGLGLGEAFLDCLFWLPGEALLLDHVVVQVVSEKFGTRTAAMAIVDAEERASRPSFVLPVLWLHDVEDDADAVLVVVADEALIRIGCVSTHYPVALIAAFSGLVVRDYDACARS